MEGISSALILALVLGALLLIGAAVYWLIASARREGERRRQAAQQLGFTPIEPDPALTEKISRISQRGGKQSVFRLRNVFRKNLLDGEMYLFDLDEVSAEESGAPQQQLVAIVSRYLNLPPFTIFPKVDQEGLAADLANRMLAWAISQVEGPVDFPEYPGFQERYLLSSPDPDAARAYFDEHILRQLAQTRLYLLRGGGDAFVFSQVDLTGKAPTSETLSRRVDLALDLFRILQSE